MELAALNDPEILNNLSDGIYITDRERRITFWNRSAERITGYSQEEVVGRRCADNLLIHVNGSGRCLCSGGCPLSTTLAEGKAHHANAFLHHKRGHRLPVQIRVLPLHDANGEVTGAIEIFNDSSVSKQLTERINTLERMAMADQLLEMPNRRYLEMTLDLRHHELKRYGWPYGVLMIDIDLFKAVNDTHGHETGDATLRMVAHTLSANSRSLDVVGRWGGEEFLAVLSHVDADRLREVAERLRIMIQESHLDLADGPLRVTASIGGAMARPDDDVAAVIDRADSMLYAAKRGGRNRIEVEGGPSAAAR